MDRRPRFLVLFLFLPPALSVHSWCVSCTGVRPRNRIPDRRSPYLEDGHRFPPLSPPSPLPLVTQLPLAPRKWLTQTHQLRTHRIRARRPPKRQPQSHRPRIHHPPTHQRQLQALLNPRGDVGKTDSSPGLAHFFTSPSPWGMLRCCLFVLPHVDLLSISSVSAKLL